MRGFRLDSCFLRSLPDRGLEGFLPFVGSRRKEKACASSKVLPRCSKQPKAGDARANGSPWFRPWAISMKAIWRSCAPCGLPVTSWSSAFLSIPPSSGRKRILSATRAIPTGTCAWPPRSASMSLSCPRSRRSILRGTRLTSTSPKSLRPCADAAAPPFSGASPPWSPSCSTW